MTGVARLANSKPQAIYMAAKVSKQDSVPVTYGCSGVILESSFKPCILISDSAGRVFQLSMSYNEEQVL